MLNKVSLNFNIVLLGKGRSFTDEIVELLDLVILWEATETND